MQAVRLRALHGHARAHDFGQAVHVAVLDAQLLADVLAHAFGGGLGAEDAGRDLEVDCRVVSHLDGGVGDEQRIGGRASENIGAQVLHHLDLALRVSRGGGDDRAARGLAAVVRAQAAREQAVAVRHLDGGVLVAVHHMDAARETVAPVLEVVRGMPHYGGLARRARRRVDARHVLLRHGEQPERVGVAHVLFHDERELRQVLEGLEVARLDAGLLERSLVERHVVIGVLHGLLHALQLQVAQLLYGHGLDVWLIVHLGCSPLNCS